MVMVDPNMYRKHVTHSSEEEVLLYVKINKALYGLLKSVLLFYKKLVASIEAYCFQDSPHDPYVANAMINGK